MTKKTASHKFDKLDKLVSKFELYLKDVSVLPLHKQQTNRILAMTAYGSNYARLGWREESIQDAVSSLRALCPNISDKLLGQMLQKLMQELFHEQLVGENGDPAKEAIIDSLLGFLDISNIRERLQTLVENTNKLSEEYLVLVPIGGVGTQYDDLHVRNVSIYSRNHPLVSQLLQEFQQQDALIFEQLDNIDCFAIVVIQGDDCYARETAEFETREAIKILNFCLSSSVHRPRWARIETASVIINQSRTSKFVGYSFARTADIPLQIDHGKKGVIKWQEILLKTDSNHEITKRILRAITWYSKAVDADSQEESFVNLTTALESLLIDKSEDNNQTTTGSINQKLRERVAFLLEETFDKRKELAQLVGKLYGTRSGIVHNGELISNRDLVRMDNITKKIIMSFAEKELAHVN